MSRETEQLLLAGWYDSVIGLALEQKDNELLGSLVFSADKTRESIERLLTRRMKALRKQHRVPSEAAQYILNSVAQYFPYHRVHDIDTSEYNKACDGDAVIKECYSLIEEYGRILAHYAKFAPGQPLVSYREIRVWQESRRARGDG